MVMKKKLIIIVVFFLILVIGIVAGLSYKIVIVKRVYYSKFTSSNNTIVFKLIIIKIYHISFIFSIFFLIFLKY